MEKSSATADDSIVALQFSSLITEIARRVWKCKLCGKEFKQQYISKRHLPVHTGERNFNCDKCDKSFKQFSTLSQHEVSKHSIVKPYVCEYCRKYSLEPQF